MGEANEVQRGECGTGFGLGNIEGRLGIGISWGVHGSEETMQKKVEEVRAHSPPSRLLAPP